MPAWEPEVRRANHLIAPTSRRRGKREVRAGDGAAERQTAAGAGGPPLSLPGGATDRRSREAPAGDMTGDSAGRADTGEC